MKVEDYAYTKMHEVGQVMQYQSLQTEITTDILTLEILTHTPIITNSTTEITLDKTVQKSSKEIAKENKAVEKRIKKAVEEDEKSRDLIQLENWSPKDSVEEGYPMYAIGDASIVEKMLNNDVAYLMFVSGESSNGDPGETEIARLGLSSFQELWKKKVH